MKDKDQDNMRDPELESMLDGLRDDPPTGLEIRRWQNATTDLDRGYYRRSQSKKLWALLAAAAAVGAIAGAGITRQLGPQENQPASCEQQIFAEHRDIDATFETTYVKLD